MLDLLALAVPALLGTGEPSQVRADESAWSALPLPRICRPQERAPQLARLAGGAHVLMPEEFEDLEEAGFSPLLPVSGLLGLLQSDAAARRLGVRFQPSAPPLLVRGLPQEVAQVRALLEDLDRVSAAWTVDLRAWITPGTGEGGSHVSAEELQRAVGTTPSWAEAQMRSGGQVVLGARRLHPFTADFRVEVAQDSGAAAARVGRFVVGRTLHLRAHRAREGAAVHLEGLLDWSELAGLEEFETGNHELGVLEQPRVHSLQVAFSGVVASGGALAVRAAGTGLSIPDWTLWIQASTPGPQAPGAWGVLDLSLLERPFDAPALPSPGGGLQFSGSRETGPALEPLTSGAVAQAGDSLRSDRGGRSPIVWAPGLLLAPAGDAALWSEMNALVAAAEFVRLRDATLLVTHGELSVLLPVAEGLLARVLAGRERTLLTRYRVEVATESWMPLPIVEHSLDGLMLQGRLQEGEVVLGAWSASSSEPRVLGREQVNVGRAQSVERAFRSGDARLAVGSAAEILPEGDGGPPLRLSLRPSSPSGQR